MMVIDKNVILRFFTKIKVSIYFKKKVFGNYFALNILKEITFFIFFHKNKKPDKYAKIDLLYTIYIYIYYCFLK